MIMQAHRLSNNKFTTQEFTFLCDRLKENPYIRYISLKWNKLDDECMKPLGEFLKVNNALESLDIRGNNFSAKGYEVLTPYLKENTKLKQFWFDVNQFNDESLPVFIKMIESSNIEDIYLPSIYSDSKKELAISLVANCLKNKAITIDLASIGLSDQDVPRICDIMNKYGIDHVKTIELGGNSITGKGLSTLFNSLKNCTSLESLYLGWNSISDECIDDLIKFLKSCPNIKYLDLSGSYTWVYGGKGREKSDNGLMTDEGVMKLFPWVIGNSMIKKVDLSFHDKIADQSLPVLIEMIEKSNIEQLDFDGKSSIFQGKLVIPLVTNRLRCGSLTQLNLANKNLNDNDIIVICGLIKKYNGSTLETIDLSHNQITSAGATVLFDTLREICPNVTKLILDSSNLDVGCIKSLDQFMLQSDTLTYLGLISNDLLNLGIDDSFVEMLTPMIVGNQHLKTLDLTYNSKITDKSVSLLQEIAERSCLEELSLDSTSVAEEKQIDLQDLINIPCEKREIPIQSTTKSAAKIGYGNVSLSSSTAVSAST